MGHTPGPWFRESDVNCDGSDWILVTKDYQEIADLRLENDGLCVPESEQDANARLIAAAPEMLALLRRGADAVGALEADCDEAGVNCYPARHWWQDVDKLIDRIEGRSE